MNYGIHWFRRDLSVSGNPALIAHLARNEGRVVGVFFFDSKFISRPDFSHNRFGFFLQTLVALREEMQELGGDLLVLDALPLDGFRTVLETLKTLQKSKPKECSWNRDYEPFARARDAAVERLLADHGIESQTASDHLVLEPHEVHRPDGGTYQVFTPFSKVWLSKLNTSVGRKQLAQGASSFDPLNKRNHGEVVEKIFHITWDKLLGQTPPWTDQLKKFVDSNRPHVTVPLPKAGSLEAYRTLLTFKTRLKEYALGRDYPNQDDTSKLSIYLKNGSITTAQIFAFLQTEEGAQPYLRQLIWREFYYHILFHHPHVEKEAFRTQYRNLKWQNRLEWFEAWKQGQTGFPIVDAGMRQLLATGLMHNRVRMIVASFLTKDLLIDWRWGEQWFMQNLLDGDLAPNNGGWQWAASTGCDPQPYFRIFNPELQSRRFDPQGDYIRKYVPELRSCTEHAIHMPSDEQRPLNYPAPIVHHAQQKLAALSLFKK